MQGRRLPDGEPHFSEIRPGDYWRDPHGTWYAMTPNQLQANLRGHTVVEHEDGTISATPSILVNRGMNPSWHGYLERGIWRTC